MVKRKNTGKADKSLSIIIIVSAVAISLVLFILLMVLGGLVESNKQTEADIKAQEAKNAMLREEVGEGTVVKPLENEIYASYTENTKEITDVRSENAILIDVTNNKVVAHKNGETRIYPASMTKVMTLIVAAENIPDFNKEFTFTYHITDPAHKANASVAGFLSSESVPLIDIMYGIALPSGADATTAIAVEVAGSEEAFVEMMNEKAAQMGLSNTHFVNASGLHDPDHYTTPHEMAIIMEHAMGNPLVAELMSTAEYVTKKTPQHPDGLTLKSTMFVAIKGDEADTVTVLAGKTGYTLEASRCLASYAEDANGNHYILVTTGAAPRSDDTLVRNVAMYDAIDIYQRYVLCE